MHPQPKHALIQGLREGGSETELTRAIAAVLSADPEMASAFLRLAVEAAPHGRSIDLSDLPHRLDCVAEARVNEGRADLSFRDESDGWHAIVEIKIYAGYGHEQIHRYLRSLRADERGVVVAITRDVPTYGDYVDGDPRWAGSVQWGRLLPGLRELRPRDPDLAVQWPLFLDVLEMEGSMGFTKADDRLFRSWADYPSARQHLVEFLDTVRRPLLDSLREALAPVAAHGSKERVEAAEFATRGKVRRAVVPRLGEVLVGFRVPADGPERLWAGLWGWGEPRFVIELPYPISVSETKDAVSTLKANGFKSRKDHRLASYLPLTDELLGSAALQETVVVFAAEAFRQIADSGVLTLETTAAAVTTDAPDVVE